MKIRVFFILAGLYFMLCNLLAQDNSSYYRPRSVYLEFGGNAVYGSINFENKFTDFKYHNVGLRVGCGWMNKLLVPLSTLNYYFGRRNHFLEIGGGIIYGDGYDYDIVWTGFIGYRYMIEKNGLFFRADFALSLRPEDIDSERVWKWGGISVGYAFKSNKKSRT